MDVDMEEWKGGLTSGMIVVECQVGVSHYVTAPTSLDDHWLTALSQAYSEVDNERRDGGERPQGEETFRLRVFSDVSYEMVRHENTGAHAWRCDRAQTMVQE